MPLRPSDEDAGSAALPYTRYPYAERSLSRVSTRRNGAASLGLRLPRIPLPVLAAGGAVAASLLGDSMLYAVMPSRPQAWGLSVAAVGVLLSANRLVRLVSNPLAALLFARVGPRAPFAAAMVLAVAVTLVYGLATAFVVLLAARMLWGVSWSMLRLGGFWAVLDEATDETRGLMMGSYTAIVRTGSLGGTVAGAVLTDAIGHRLTLSIFSALIALSGAAWFFATRTHAGARSPAAARADGEGGLASVLRDRRLLIVSAGGMVSGLVFAGLVFASIGFYLRESYGSEVAVGGLAIGVTSLTGLLLGAYGMLNVPIGPAAGLVSDWLGRSGVTQSAFALGALGLAVLAATSAVWLTLLGVVIAFAAAAALAVLLAASAGDLAPPERRSAVMSTYVTFLDLGAAIGPLAGLSFGSLDALRIMFGAGALMLLAMGLLHRAAFVGERPPAPASAAR